MKQVKYHPAAGEEAEEAAAWYEAERIGLGEDFAKELHAAVMLLRDDLAASLSHRQVPMRLEVRRLLLKRFPYSVVFVERGETTFIVAVAHQARRPGYWKRRLRT